MSDDENDRPNMMISDTEFWHGYNFGGLTIGVFPRKKSLGKHELAMTVHLNGPEAGGPRFTLAVYPTEAEALAGLRTLDAAMDYIEKAIHSSQPDPTPPDRKKQRRG